MTKVKERRTKKDYVEGGRKKDKRRRLTNTGDGVRRRTEEDEEGRGTIPCVLCLEEFEKIPGTSGFLFLKDFEDRLYFI